MIGKFSALLFSVLILGPAVTQEPQVDSFTELHERAREVERTLVTLRADFVETTESDLLAEPITARGTMVASRPLRVLLRYDEPERKILLIDGNERRMVWLERREEEKMPLGEIQNAVDKYFYRVSEKELGRHFEIQVSSDPALPGTHQIDMIAKGKQVKKGLERLQIWLEESTLFMVKMRMIYPAGVGSKTIELSNLRANVPIEDEEFQIPLPPDPQTRP